MRHELYCTPASPNQTEHAQQRAGPTFTRVKSLGTETQKLIRTSRSGKLWCTGPLAKVCTSTTQNPVCMLYQQLKLWENWEKTPAHPQTRRNQRGQNCNTRRSISSYLIDRNIEFRRRTLFQTSISDSELELIVSALNEGAVLYFHATYFSFALPSSRP
jgi:hypothetical protein